MCEKGFSCYERKVLRNQVTTKIKVSRNLWLRENKSVKKFMATGKEKKVSMSQVATREQSVRQEKDATRKGKKCQGIKFLREREKSVEESCC